MSPLPLAESQNRIKSLILCSIAHNNGIKMYVIETEWAVKLLSLVCPKIKIDAG